LQSKKYGFVFPTKPYFLDHLSTASFKQLAISSYTDKRQHSYIMQAYPVDCFPFVEAY